MNRTIEITKIFDEPNSEGAYGITTATHYDEQDECIGYDRWDGTDDMNISMYLENYEDDNQAVVHTDFEESIFEETDFYQIINR
jgi:hypothetical protein